MTDGPAQMSSPIEQAGMSASHEVGGRTQSMDEGDSLDGAPTVGAAFGVNTQYASLLLLGQLFFVFGSVWFYCFELGEVNGCCG